MADKKTGKKQFNDGKPGPGRPKGTRNKLTVAVKDAIEHAFDEVGGVEYLKMIAVSDPKTFCTLLGKVIPLQVAGDPDNPVGMKFTVEYLK